MRQFGIRKYAEPGATSHRRGVHSLALILVGVLSGCTFDYTDGQVESRRTEETPQLELLNVRMVVERENRLELSAERIAIYRERRTQEFRKLSFREFDATGTIRLEGYADGGVMNIDTEDVELLGEVRLISTVENAEMESAFLSWDSAARVLRGAPDQEVRIHRDDGSWVEGRGLRVDGRRNLVEFEEGFRGEFRQESEE